MIWTYTSGLINNKPQLKSGGPGSFLERGEYKFAFQSFWGF